MPKARSFREATQPHLRMRWSPRVRIEHLWLSLPVLLVVWKSFLHPLRVLDFWWHLKAGEVIVTTRSIPKTDLFSFTAAGKPFVLQNWLTETLYYLVYRLGGLPLLVALNTALLVAALVPIYHLSWELSGRRLRLSALVTFMAAFSLAIYSNMRPQIVSFALFAFFYWVLSGYRQHRRDLLWTLPLLMVLWVNLHGAFVLGIGLIGLLLGGEAVRRLVHGPQADTLSTAELRKLALILGFTLLATLANPETYRVYAYVAAVQADRASQLLVAEWQAPQLDRWEDVLIFFGPFFVTLLVLLYAPRRLDLTELGLFLGFTAFALTARRNGIWFVLVATPLVARYLPTIRWTELVTSLQRFRITGRLTQRLERRNEATVPVRYGLNAFIAGMLLLITGLLSPWVHPRLGIQRLGTTLWEPKTPVKAMEFIAARNLQGNIFHPQIYGDYLIWRLWPQQRSFIDGRVHLFGEAFVRNYLLTWYDRHWEERLEAYDIRYLLLSKGEENNAQMIESARASSRWRVLYEDERSVLFEKVRSP